MKLGKKFMVCTLAAVMTLGSAIGVYAAENPSLSKEITTTQAGVTAESKIEETESFKAIQENAPVVAEMILQVTEGTMEMDAFIEKLNEMTEEIGDETAKATLEKAIKDLEGKIFVTAFVDISVDADVEKNEEGKYEVTLNVPSLTSKTTNVMVLHYSTERSVWEVIEPADVDVDAKTVTAEFEDLSPVAVIADAEAK